uniref:Uncharacterized protein n=1 Tax=Streptomyces sp. F12 TaxID=1436084 RepID=V9Z7K6_9ACTN|nr:hypothetical protein pFRL6_21 [Streptomyces sp. F12]
MDKAVGEGGGTDGAARAGAHRPVPGGGRCRGGGRRASVLLHVGQVQGSRTSWSTACGAKSQEAARGLWPSRRTRTPITGQGTLVSAGCRITACVTCSSRPRSDHLTAVSPPGRPRDADDQHPPCGLPGRCRPRQHQPARGTRDGTVPAGLRPPAQGPVSAEHVSGPR